MLAAVQRWSGDGQGVADGQGGLVCCSPWDHKELDMTDWTELMIYVMDIYKISQGLNYYLYHEL